MIIRNHGTKTDKPSTYPQRSKNTLTVGDLRSNTKVDFYTFHYFKFEWGETMRALAIKYNESIITLLAKSQHVKISVRR